MRLPTPSDAARELLEHLRAGRYAAAVAAFDDAMRQALPEPALRAAWEQVAALLDPDAPGGDPELHSLGTHIAVTLPLAMSGGTMPMRVVLDAEGRFAGLSFGAPAAAPDPPPPDGLADGASDGAVAAALAALFPGGAPLAYRTVLVGKPLATQWTIPVGRTSDGGYAFELMLEVDHRVNGGGAAARHRAWLACDRWLRPRAYRSESADAVVDVVFAGPSVWVSAPGALPRALPRDGAQAFRDPHMPGLLALLLAREHALRRGLLDEARVDAFYVHTSVTAPWRLRQAGPALETSHEERLHLDSDGVLAHLEERMDGFETERVKPPLPLPAWRHDASLATAPRAVYRGPPVTVRAEDVTLDGPTGLIGGTLTLPVGPGPFPAVLFLGGSGTHDRHGLHGALDLGYHEIVDSLSAAGFVGLRIDARRAGGLGPVIADAKACWDHLAARPEVDPAHMAIVAHSEGATIALALATECKGRASAVALLAPLGRPIDEALAEQLLTHARQVGLPADVIDRRLRRWREFMALACSDAAWTDDVPDLHRPNARLAPWLRDHRAHPPREMVKDLRCPLLICQGLADIQVSPPDHAGRLAEAARAAGLSVTYRTYEALDHLLKPVSGASTLASYYAGGRATDPTMLADLSRWLWRHLALALGLHRGAGRCQQ